MAGFVVSSLHAGSCSRSSSLPIAPPPIDSPQIEGVEVEAAEGVNSSVLSTLRDLLGDAVLSMRADESLRRDVIITGSISRLEHDTSGPGHRAHCTVSLAVRDADSGRLLVVLEGQSAFDGGVPSSQSALESIEDDLVFAATRSVLLRLEAARDQLSPSPSPSPSP